MAKAMEKKPVEEKAAEQAVMKEKAAEQAKETVYTVKELADNAMAVFRTRPECVLAALQDGGKSAFTVSEAEEIVRKFLEKEVR